MEQGAVSGNGQYNSDPEEEITHYLGEWYDVTGVNLER
jgi:hypothetical protein